jgi:Dolichyl-phosphate-mannose-protein mannosyltransferase
VSAAAALGRGSRLAAAAFAHPPGWLAPVLLALPFVIGVAVLRGLTVEIDTFHGSDARVYQLPTILQLSERLDFSDYPSAQTPLYHLLTAGWGELVGFELWKLRLLNVLFSYGMALALLRLLRRATPLGTWQALALTVTFVLSPYVYGASFTLLTDNLGILFALLALERIHAYTRSGSLAAFALACLAIAAALLTRQAFVWLVPVAAIFLARRELVGVSARRVPGRLVGGAVLVALALVPLGLLVLEWDGLVPPSADPASCGLCDDRQGLAREALTLRTVGFSVALAGAYAVLVFGPSLVRRLRRLRSSVLARAYVGLTGSVRSLRLGLVAAAAVGAALLLVSPLLYQPITPSQAGDAGYLWKISEPFPELLGSSLVFWLLVPLGCVALYLLVRRAGVWSLPAVYLACFLLAALPVRLVYQKYFDPFMLLGLALLARPPDLRRRGDYAGLALMCVAFVAYALSFAG